MKEALFDTHAALEDRHWWFRGRREAIRALAVRLLPGGGSVVDVGCGTGADLASLPATWDRYGIDVSARAIEHARARHPEVEFEVGEAPSAGADRIAAADLVLLCDVLEHIEDDAGFLGSLGAIMGGGATLLLMVPADPRLWSPHDEVYDHYRRYTRSTLAAAWSGAPFRPRLVAPLNRRLLPLARVTRGWGRLVGRGPGAEASDLWLPWGPVNRWLEGVMVGEVPELVAALDDGRAAVPGSGVSLVAVLERVGEAAGG